MLLDSKPEYHCLQARRVSLPDQVGGPARLTLCEWPASVLHADASLTDLQQATARCLELCKAARQVLQPLVAGSAPIGATCLYDNARLSLPVLPAIQAACQNAAIVAASLVVISALPCLRVYTCQLAGSRCEEQGMHQLTGTHMR